MAAGPVVMLAAVAAAGVACGVAGVPLRDPGHVTARRLLTTALLLLAVVVVDVVVGAARSARGGLPGRTALLAAWRARWTPRRVLATVIAVLSFYGTYLAYRNIKSVVPVLRPGALFDRQLDAVDRWLTGGRPPADVLQGWLGTGTAAHVLSAGYMLFFAFIPLSLVLALVRPRRPEGGLFYATALGLNWLLGAGTYLLLPAIGPFDLHPALFADLPATAAGHLQDTLAASRASFLRDPGAPGAAQSIGAFASLHTSIFVTAILAGRRLAWPRPLQAVVWLLALVTVVATIYFGWHYVLDDVAGAVIAVVSILVAASLTGLRGGRQEAA